MASHDSLPYIDPNISPTERESAEQLIRSELLRQSSYGLHPSTASLPTSKLAPSQQLEVERAGAGHGLTGGIDLSRYESFDDVSESTDTGILRNTLQNAYANITYLQDRQTNIDLLEDHGKSAWLIGNLHLEDVHKRLEAELVAVKDRSERTNRIRKGMQEGSRGELLGLEETWKQGIRGIVETQIATDRLRDEIPQESGQSLTNT